MSAEPTQAARYVFLSYASADRERALHIADQLEAQGVSVWIDRKSIAGGTSWSAEIVEGIKSCAVLAVLISRASADSRNVQQEIQLAWENDRKVLPLILEMASLPSSFEYALAGRQWIDVLDRPDEVWGEQVLYALRGLGVGPPGTTPFATPLTEAQSWTSQSSLISPGRAEHRNLPAQLTSFVGREQERVEVERLLQTNRLVTLTGTGGVGKTRLALQVAQAMWDDFPDGVSFISLAAISEPGLIASTISQVLGLREVGSRSAMETLQAYLQDRWILLVIDNFEHVLPAAPLVADLLAGCKKLKILVTSRATLHIRGEREFILEPLRLPDPERLPSLDNLIRCDAVALFIQRARDVKSDFALTRENAAPVAEICARLDGLPLAIELAAARIKVLSPQALLTRMESSLKILTGGARDLPARQQTLRRALQWSYDLLDDGERLLFRRLGVFRGGCTLQAVETLAQAIGAEGQLALPQSVSTKVLDELAALIGCSLVRQQEQSDGEMRFLTFETIREYALELLTENGELEDVLRRHALYYLALAEANDPEFVDPWGGARLDHLEREHDNLRAALHWALRCQEAELGLRIGGVLGRLWATRGYLTDGRQWLARLLAMPAGLEVAAVRAKALGVAAALAWRQGDFASERRLLEEALAIYERLNDRPGLGTTLIGLGLAAVFENDFREARASFEKALVIARELEDHRANVACINGFGIIAFWGENDSVAARAHWENGLDIARELGDLGLIAEFSNNLGLVSWHEGDYQTASTLQAESLRIRWELRDIRGVISVLDCLAALAVAQKLPERAWRIASSVAALRSSTGLQIMAMWQNQFTSVLVPARQALSDEAFATAWAEGQAMTLDEAVAYAQEENGA